MKSQHAAFIILAICLSMPVLAQQAAPPASDPHSAASENTAQQQETPAQQRIAAAQLQINTDPKKAQAYNELTLAFLRRARETADDKYLSDADNALTQGLKLEPENFQLQKTQVALMLSRHQFAQAEERAKALNHHTPDDVMTYGYLAESEIGLGNYAEAVTNAQWMMNMRPRNTPALLIGARLRSLYGDPHGAIDFLQLAYSQTSPVEVEDLAWIANQIASIQIESGQIDGAAQTLATAEQIFPGYPYTIENLARVRATQNRTTDAGQLRKQAASTESAPNVPQAEAPLESLAASHRTESSSSVQRPNSPFTFAPVSATLMTPQPTETGQIIRNAQTKVRVNPKDAGGYARLGAAYFQHARETGDVGDYQLSEETLRKSLDLVGEDFSADEALGTMAEVCMGEHRFADALSYAQKALSLGTGDVSSFAIVGDAYADMGEYDKAAAAYGKLTPRDMTLSPRAAYARDSRLAYLKFVAGDTDAAIALMKTAVTEGVEAQLPRENQAWLYYELGEFDAQAGDAPAADTAYLAALNTHPGDYRALAALAKLRANNARYSEAIELYQKAIAVVPMPSFIAELGDLYVKTGNLAEAQKQYALVEYIGLLGHINQVLHNRDLALFYADHDIKLAESLDLAQKELEVRHDIYTWDALAWALYKNGKLSEAATASEKALRLGTRDPLLLYHAGMIAEGLGQHEQARNEMKQALDINPHFHPIYADAARKQLNAMETQTASKEGPHSHAL